MVKKRNIKPIHRPSQTVEYQLKITHSDNILVTEIQVEITDKNELIITTEFEILSPEEQIIVNTLADMWEIQEQKDYERMISTLKNFVNNFGNQQ